MSLDRKHSPKTEAPSPGKRRHMAFAAAASTALAAAAAALCVMMVLVAATQGGALSTSPPLMLLSSARRASINAAFSRSGLGQARTRQVKTVVARLQNLLGQAAQVRAYGNIYKRYGDAWRGLPASPARRDQDSELQRGDETRARSSAHRKTAGASGVTPCNAGGGAVVFSARCAPYPFGGLPLWQTPQAAGSATLGPFGAEASAQSIATSAVSIGATMPPTDVSNAKKRQSLIAAAIAAGVAAPSPGTAMPAWAVTDIPKSTAGGLPSQSDRLCPRGCHQGGAHEPRASGGLTLPGTATKLKQGRLEASMDAYIRAGLSAPSGLGGPVPAQPVWVGGKAAAGTLPAHGGDVAQRLAADESAIATLTKDVNELLTANQYLMTEAALGGRPGPRGIPGPPGPPGVH